VSKSAARNLPKVRPPHWLDAVIASLIKEIERSDFSKDDRKQILLILHSIALKKAFCDLRDGSTDDDVRRMILRIVSCLGHIHRAALQYRSNPDALFASNEIVDALWKGFSLLEDARYVLAQIDRPAPWDYAREITDLLERIRARDPLLIRVKNKHFSAKNLKQKGGAANRNGAFNGLMVLELSARVPANAPKRATAIADLQTSGAWKVWTVPVPTTRPTPVDMESCTSARQWVQ
jgi:hypothetical protein